MQRKSGEFFKIQGWIWPGEINYLRFQEAEANRSRRNEGYCERPSVTDLKSISSRREVRRMIHGILGKSWRVWWVGHNGVKSNRYASDSRFLDLLPLKNWLAQRSYQGIQLESVKHIPRHFLFLTESSLHLLLQSVSLSTPLVPVTSLHLTNLIVERLARTRLQVLPQSGYWFTGSFVCWFVCQITESVTSRQILLQIHWFYPLPELNTKGIASILSFVLVSSRSSHLGWSSCLLASPFPVNCFCQSSSPLFILSASRTCHLWFRYP
jgi:hypothetical protein